MFACAALERPKRNNNDMGPTAVRNAKTGPGAIFDRLGPLDGERDATARAGS